MSLHVAADGYRDLLRQPDTVTVITETCTVSLSGVEGVWSGAGIRVTVTPEADGLQVRLAAPDAKPKKVILQWKEAPEGKDWKYLGDAWERSYGDLEWRPPDAGRPMPWYFLASDGQTTHGYGVMTLPSAMCCWTRDAAGVTLTADVRSGGRGVELGERLLEVCTIVSRRGQAGETPFAAAHEFCVLLCPSPLMPEEPVYGFNNWYCDYGDITPEGVRQDAAFITRLAPAGPNRPYMVVDDGWQADYTPAAGAWDRGNDRFPDMPGLAADIVATGAKPGIWVRLLLAQPEHPESWRQVRDPSCLDPSVPDVREYVVTTVERLRAWGYELIKHDYSVLDLAGRFGFQSEDEVIPDGHAFADTSRTTAEIIVDHYRSIREAAGDDSVVMGCTTFGHLSAGLFEISRTGDDTSGLEWARVRRMGVNTMAFRMPQHGAFFAIDGDCVGQTSAESIPWEQNRQWLDLLARSGTPLFVSFREGVTPEHERAIAAALAVASRPMPVAEPLDWFDTLAPQRWKMSDSEAEFHWSDRPMGSGMPARA